MQTSQGAAREICEHYYPILARDMLRYNNQVRDRQLVTSFTNPAYNVYQDKAFSEQLSGTLDFLMKTSKPSILDLTKHELANLMLLIFYGYPELSDTCWPDQKLPKDSLNRLFILLERYNKLIKRRQVLNLPKILRGIVLNDVQETVCSESAVQATD